ncbi:MAG: NADase-type glycan-binding domain-containing protein, partial [Cyclobacteriaceae bacterium]
LSYKTAWVEGVPGYGIGESLTYHFPPHTPRITKIIVVNGYAKSPKAWSENSRVKKLKLYINNKPIAILNLQDTRAEQIFTFDPIGNANREDKALRSMPQWTMKFEIMGVYKGEKYDDTAITEIYFDGIDVH